MRWTARAAVAALSVAALWVAVSGAATAQTGKHLATAPHATHLTGKQPELGSATPNALPPNYHYLSEIYTAEAGVQSHGTATCPAKSVPYGGGVLVGSGSTAVNVNGSYPVGNQWIADVNNASGSASEFDVYVVCAKKNAAYSIVAGDFVVNHVGAQNRATVECPAGTKVLSGGGFSDVIDTAVNENSSFPIKSGKGTSAIYGWAVDENNASASPANVHAIAVCGRLGGYKLLVGTATTNPAGTQTGAFVACPAPKVPIGGGSLSSSPSIAVNINTSYPTGIQTWRVYENNASAAAASFTPYVICAGT